MKRVSIYIALIITTFIVVASCKKIETLSETPHIEFESFSVFDTIDILGNVSKGGCLKITFEDGDGDVGLAAPTFGETDTTNLFLSLLRKNGDDFVKVTDYADPLMPLNYRIPLMRENGQERVMKGTISLRIIYTIASTDTVKYEVQIKDRSDNYSNTVTTCEIPLSLNGTYTL